jgi:hypothetical protein
VAVEVLAYQIQVQAVQEVAELRLQVQQMQQLELLTQVAVAVR